jgi:penicillin-binding protein 1A
MRRLLRIDAWIDSQLATIWASLRDRWSATSSLFARMRLTGWKRGLTEIGSEALTLGAGGLAVMYALAIPALVEFDEARLNQGKYSVKFLDRNGNEIGKRGILINDGVPLDEIPAHLIQATLATEDRRFYEHIGVDVFGTARALYTNANAGETVQGGSTLTQQLAKNLFLSSERSLRRKIKELYLAFLLESRLTKREILKLYLDRAYMGGGAFGVEAAAQFYFGKSVRDVTLAEAAMMAGLFKAPGKFAPHINLANARGRANEVLSNLVEAGYMTAGQVHAARLNPARPIETRQPYSPDWFLDWAFEEVQRIAEGRNQFSLIARTTIDVGLQQAAEEAVTSVIRQYGKTHNARTGALVSMNPDGAVRALVGGLDYAESQFNRATNARRQPGSSFKLYVYAAALENGFTPRSVLRDYAPAPCGPRGWQPKNYSGDSGGGGSYTLQDAFKQSLNTIATDLALYKLGANSRDKVIQMTERLGVKGVKKTCSMALGDTGISLLEHTGAYGVFANNGKSATPYAILELYSTKGDLVYSREREEPVAAEIVKPRVAEQMNQLMAAVVNEGTGKRAALEFTHAVGKTGTSSSYRDALFMGFTGQLVTGLWIGNDDFRPMIIQPSARTGSASGVTGGGLPAIAWNAFMTVAHPDKNIAPIPGLPPHPVQVAEQQRLAEARRADPSLAAAQAAQKRNTILNDQTRDTLKKLAEAMRRANGIETPTVQPTSAPPAQPGARPATPPVPGSAPTAPAGRRAETPAPSTTIGPTAQRGLAAPTGPSGGTPR